MLLSMTLNIFINHSVNGKNDKNVFRLKNEPANVPINHSVNGKNDKNVSRLKNELANDKNDKNDKMF